MIELYNYIKYGIIHVAYCGLSINEAVIKLIYSYNIKYLKYIATQMHT